MKWIIGALVLSLFVMRLGAQEVPLVISIEGPAAWKQALNLLAQYADTSYVYEEDVIPLEAFQEKIRFRALQRRPVSLTFTVDPALDVAANLETLRQAVAAQEELWAVRAEGVLVEGIPILTVADAHQGGAQDGSIGLARPRPFAGSYTTDIFSRVLARTQKTTFEEMGVNPLILGEMIVGVRREVGSEISGEWPHPRAGALALIQHAEQERGLRFGFEFWTDGYRENSGEHPYSYIYYAQLVGSNARLQHPHLRAGGTFIVRERNDLDLASAEILAQDNTWVFVARQRPAVLGSLQSSTGHLRSDIRGGAGGVYFLLVDSKDPSSEVLPAGYVDGIITAHCPPGASIAAALERAFNEPHTIPGYLSSIPRDYGPVRFLPREGGGHYLYFGAGLFLDPERSHDDHSFAQVLPAIEIPPGVTLAAAVEQLYQALPETPEQSLMLAEGDWQEVILTEGLSLGNRTFASAVCDLFSVMGLPPGILRVHYGISEQSYIFTYHEPESD